MRYKVKDTVLSFDNGVLYEAKIMKIQEFGGERKYFIHYNGWARKYDLWMDEDQLADKNDPFAVEQLTAAAQEKLVPTGKRGKSSKQSVIKIGKQKIDVDSVSRGPVQAANSTATGANMSLANTEEVERLLKEKKNAASKGIELVSFDARAYQRDLLQQDLFDQVEDETLVEKIKLTLSMKRHLLDDWNLITKEMNNRLIRLPKSHFLSVSGIFELFLAKKRKQLLESQMDVDEESNFTMENYEDFFHGLRIQFNRALPNLLLFRQERAQFDLLKSSEALQGRSNSEIFGAEHLIRFFVRMPKQLSGVVLQKEALSSIFDVLNQLISFIDASDRHFSVMNYITKAEAIDHIRNFKVEEDEEYFQVEDEKSGRRNKKKRKIEDI